MDSQLPPNDRGRGSGATAAPALDIVCLEDDEHDAELARAALLRSVRIGAWRIAASRDEFVDALNARLPDLILADYRLPNFDGREALAIARRVCPRVPFIFLSGTLGEELAIETLKLGATDYVVKDRMWRLAPAVQRAVAEAEAIRSRSDAQSALAAQDALLKRIVDALPDLIYATDSDGRVTVANQSVLRVLRRAPQVVLGRPVSEFAKLLGALVDDDGDRRLMESRRAVVDREYLWRDPDGAQRCRTYSKLPLIDPVANSVTGLVVVSRDITESRVLERAVLEITEREQRRVGSDLHDGLGQELTGLALMIKGLEAELAREGSRHLPQVRRIGDVLRDAFASARSLAQALAPTQLERGEIGVALEQLARHCTSLFGIPCEAHTEPNLGVALDDDAANHLYRIAQEAMVNAAKHANATRIVVGLARVGVDLQLSIDDDGIGFDPDQQDPRLGMGLRTMGYRARMMSGSLCTFRGPHGGTRVECRIPIKQNQRAA